MELSLGLYSSNLTKVEVMQLKIIKSIHQQTYPVYPAIKTYRERMTVTHQKGTTIIQKSKIKYLKADNNYCEIHLQDGQVILCSKTMKDISRKLNNPHFIKVHQSYIVHISGISFIDKSFTALLLVDGTEIPVSRVRKEDLKAMMKLRFD